MIAVQHATTFNQRLALLSNSQRWHLSTNFFGEDVGDQGRMSSESSRMMFLEGVIISRFDLILGPTPAAVYPKGFLTDEVAKKVAEEAMLLLSAAKQRSYCSVMSLHEIDKLGIVGLELDPIENAIGIITIFDKQADGLIWRTYPSIRSLTMGEMQNARRRPSDVALRIFDGLEKLAAQPDENKDMGRLLEELENSIEKTLLSVTRFTCSPKPDEPEPSSPNIEGKIAQLLAALEDTRIILKERLNKRS
jgi:hypothetical protein